MFISAVYRGDYTSVYILAALSRANPNIFFFLKMSKTKNLHTVACLNVIDRIKFKSRYFNNSS